jgi:hypothetical protein
VSIENPIRTFFAVPPVLAAGFSDAGREHPATTRPARIRALTLRRMIGGKAYRVFPLSPRERDGVRAFLKAAA